MPPKQKKLEESGMKPENAGKENGKRIGRPRMRSLRCALTSLLYNVPASSAISHAMHTFVPAAEEAEDTLQAEEQHNDKKAKQETRSNRTATADPQEPLTKSQPKNVVEEGRIYFFYR